MITREGNPMGCYSFWIFLVSSDSIYVKSIKKPVWINRDFFSGTLHSYKLLVKIRIVLKNELFKCIIPMLFDHQSFKKSTMDILCIQKGSTKHMNPCFILWQ